MLLVDCRGLTCPQPVINTRRVVEVNPEETVVAVVDNATARENLLVMAEGLGRTAEWQEDGPDFRVIIRPSVPRTEKAPSVATEAAEAPGCSAATKASTPEGSFVVALGSDRLGQGDETLGTLLMKSFLATLLEVEPPAALVCLNRGVFLVTSGSPVLEPLRQLEERGTEILACGTCLDFYERRQDLQVGKVSNMFTILQRMVGADRLIRW